MLSKMPLKLKLLTLIGIPVVTVMIITALSIYTVNNIFNNMKHNIFDEHLKTTTLILNTDRDMYQALTAMQAIMYFNSNTTDSEEYIKSFNENIGQVKERSEKIRNIMNSNRSLWDKVKAQRSQMNIFEDFKAFESDFNDWIKICESIITSQTKPSDWTDKFDTSREYINLIGEAIEESSIHQMNLISDNRKSMITIIIIIDIITFIAAIILSLVLISIVFRSLRSIREAAEEIALGNTDAIVDVKSKDEIGNLAKTFEKMIESIRQNAYIAEKISNGDLNIDVAVKSEKDVLSISLKSVINTLKNLVSETGLLTKAAVDGNLSIRGNADNFDGGYKDIIHGVNKTLDAVIEPIQEAASVLEEMSRGNLDSHVKGNYSGDHAKIKDLLNGTIFALSDYVSEISNVLTQMANGNMNVSIDKDYKGSFSEIKNSLNLIVDSFNDILTDINLAAQQVASGSSQISDSAQALSQGSTEQASTLEEFTATIEQISTQIKQNAANANQANELAISAQQAAVDGNTQMKEMLKAMEAINTSANNISKIIKVIDEIAFQTNILALNAAVEAARAGQHGKGFAVVAEEVRNLAARSANAAKETTNLIESSIKLAKDGTTMANSTDNALNKIVEAVAKAAMLVNDITEASNEQATGIAQINQGIIQVSQVVQINSATSQESASASEELSSQAERLSDMVGKFKLRKPAYTQNNTHELITDVQSYENIARKRNKINSSSTNRETPPPKTRISLNDYDFGKY